MPAPYNLTNITNVQVPADLVVAANIYTESLFMGLMLIAIFIVFTMRFMVKNKFGESLLGSSFICFIASLFLRQAGLINFVFVIGFLVVMAFTGMLMYITRQR